jgi:hypothetical protein
MRNIILKILAIVGFILLSFGILLAWKSPATGYEASIYKSTPLIFWIAVSFCIVVGTISVVQQISSKNKNTNLCFPFIPFLLIFLSFAAILSLFIIRGYALFGGGDPLTHIGSVQDIISSGQANRQLIYPITHIYVAQFAEICGISTFFLSKLIPLIFALLNILFTYCLARMLLPERGQVILATALGMTFIEGWYLELTPNHLANLFFPFFIYIIMKSLNAKGPQWNVMTIILLFLLPAFHPIPYLVILLFLLAIPLTNRIVFRFRKETPLPDDTILKFSSITLLFLIVWGITWISSFAFWDYEVRQVSTLFLGGGSTKIGSLIAQLDYATSYNYSVAGMFLKTYGGILLLMVLTMIAIIVLWKRRDSISQFKLLIYLIVPLIFVGVAIVALFPLNLDFGPLRLLYYVVFMCNYLSAILLFGFLKTKSRIPIPFKTKLLPLIASLVIIGLFVLGTLKVYPSRYVLDTNSQYTQTEINGTDWFLHNNNQMKNTTYLWNPELGRFADLLLTVDERSNRQDIPNSEARHLEFKLPWHFGYDQGKILGQYYVKDIYLVLNQMDRSIYTDLYPEMAKMRFEAQDFTQLENDSSVDKLYANGGFDTYYVHGLAPAGVQIN